MAEDPRDYVPQKPGKLFYIGWLAAFLIVLVAMAGLVRARDIWIHRQTDNLVQESKQGMEVLVRRIVRADRSRPVTIPGYTRGYIETYVYAKIAGYMKTIFVDKGDKVKTGQLLAIIESPELDHQVADALAKYQISEISDKRYQALLATAVVSQQESDVYHAQALQDYASWQQLRAMQAYEKIYAPFDGVITARLLDPGQLIPESTESSNNTPIVSMATLSPMRVFAEFPQSVSTFIKNGDPATVTVNEYPERQFVGTVTRHPEALNTSTRTMLVEVDLPNHDSALYPGMYAHISIDIAAKAGAPLVPDDALIFRGEKVFVPTVEENKLRVIEVKLGYDDGQYVEIIHGLKGNELVAMNVGQTAENGTLVRPVMAKK